MRVYNIEKVVIRLPFRSIVFCSKRFKNTDVVAKCDDKLYIF